MVNVFWWKINWIGWNSHLGKYKTDENYVSFNYRKTNLEVKRIECLVVTTQHIVNINDVFMATQIHNVSIVSLPIKD